MSVATETARELEKARESLISENNDILHSVKSEDGTVIVEEKQSTAYRANISKIKELTQNIDAIREQELIEQGLQRPEHKSVALEAQASSGVDISKLSHKSIGQLFVDSDEFKAFAQSGALTMPQGYQIKGATLSGRYVETKDVYTDLPTGDPGSFGRVQRDDLVDRPQRRVRIRDLFPIQGTDANVIEFFRSTGYNTAAANYATNAASPVAERDGSDFYAKPQTELKFEGVTVPVRTIAHWEAAHRNVLADEPQLRGIIDTELLYGLRLEEDNQILNGAGTSNDLTGILVDSGIQTYSWSSGETLPVVDTRVDAIRRAMTKAFLANYEPTGIVCHPNDWEKMELAKDDNGQYLVAMSVAAGGEQRLWRVPVVDSPAIDEGTALVGAFGLGAQLYDREEGSIRVAEQHSDFFVRNAIVILAEQRLALAIKRPESFVKVTFDTAPS